MIDYEVIVIGAGVGGIYQIKKLTDRGINAIVLEGEDDLGGTWNRNRYPGCRFDSESYTYGYSFSEELLEEWHWKERFSGQPENLRYLNFVADKFDLRKHMRFSTRVRQMTWSEEETLWELVLETGETLRSRFVITSLGPLSIPTMPRIPGMDDFKGESFHTFYWPRESLDLSDKRVGIIGTGATGIQIIGEIADKVKSLTVFQRRPNWSSPLNNSAISDEEMADIRRRYDEIFANCAKTASGFEHLQDRRGFWNVTREEREATWDKLYASPGFAILAGNFVEIFFDEEANREFSEYIANRIRARVDDPATAEMLIPKDHGFGMQRLPLETRYFEAYNRDNVSLVDISTSPISRITGDGIETRESSHELDVLIYATGFDAITGGYDAMDIRGIDGQSLGEKWTDGPVTFNGIMSNGFPNMMMVAGPQSASGSSNFPRAIEVNVNWVTDLITHAQESGITRIESSDAAEKVWQEEVKRSYASLLLSKGQGWFIGYNSNIEGRSPETNRYPAYQGGGARYAQILKDIAESGYEPLSMS